MSIGRRWNAKWTAKKGLKFRIDFGRTNIGMPSLAENPHFPCFPPSFLILFYAVTQIFRNMRWPPSWLSVQPGPGSISFDGGWQCRSWLWFPCPVIRMGRTIIGMHPPAKNPCFPPPFLIPSQQAALLTFSPHFVATWPLSWLSAQIGPGPISFGGGRQWLLLWCPAICNQVRKVPIEINQLRYIAAWDFHICGIVTRDHLLCVCFPHFSPDIAGSGVDESHVECSQEKAWQSLNGKIFYYVEIWSFDANAKVLAWCEPGCQFSSGPIAHGCPQSLDC